MGKVVGICRISGNGKIVLPCNWVVSGFCGADGRGCRVEVVKSD